jgi:hypothetical protein
LSTPELPEDGHLSNPNPSAEKENAPDKNKGGRPRGRDYYCNHKVHIYLTDKFIAVAGPEFYQLEVTDGVFFLEIKLNPGIVIVAFQGH